MTEGRTPAEVDPALWAEFQQISDRVHELHRLREIEGVTPQPPTRRMVLDVPEEWFLLFAWVAGRETRRQQGLNEATGLTPERIGLYEDAMRKTVSRYLWRTLNNHFHDKLHDLATGGSRLLRPLPAKADTAGDPAGLDDGIPF